MFTVNHNEANSFEVLPVGEYEVVITETKVDESSEKKTPYVGMTMTIRDEADINPTGRKQKIFHNMYYTEKTVGMFQSLFKALMFDQGKVMNSLEDVAREIKGCSVRVRIKHEMYEGEPRVRVQYFKQSQKPLKRIEPSAIVGEDPFSGNGQININDDDLPF